MDDSEFILVEIQASLTTLAQDVGIDPDGLDDESVIRSVGRSFDDLKAVNADLLAACKAASEKYSELWKKSDTEYMPFFNAMGNQVDVIRKAIAKAEGGGQS